MGQQSASARAAERSAMMQQKRKTVDAVRVRFARFGDEVLAIVLGFALKPKSMPILMQRLNLRPSGDLASQLDAIWEYIAQSSTKEFLKHVKRVQQRDVEALDVNKLIEDVATELRNLGVVTVDPGREAKPKPEVGEDDAPEGAAPAGLTYPAIDRRQGGDRRKKQERRHDIAAIDRNRRFGGERRKRPKGRRKSDYGR